MAWLLAGAAAAVPLLAGSTRREQLLALNSLYLAAATCAVALPIGALLAALLARTDVLLRRPAFWVLAALLFMPLYLVTAAWDAGFGRQGWFSVLLGSLAAPPLEGWRGAVWVHAMAAIPWTVLIIAAGLRRVMREGEEAALLDASPAAVFWSVTLPASWDSVGLAALWMVIVTLGEITVTDMYQVSTYARELYIGFALGEFLLGAGEAQAAENATFGVWPGVAHTAWLAAAAAAFLGGLARWDRPAALRPPITFRLGRWRWLAALGIGAALVLLAGVPIGNLLYQAGIHVELVGDDRVRGWSIGKAFSLVTEASTRFRDEVFWTSVLGALVATLAVTLAAPLSWLARRGGARAAPALALAVAGMAIPGPLIGLGLIALLNRAERPWLIWLYDDTLFAPTLAMLARTLPWAILVCWFAFRSLPEEILESGQLDGAGALARFFFLAAPQRLAALGLAWLLSLVIATGDLASSILVIPPGIDTLAVHIFGLIHAGVDDRVAAICLVVMLSVAVSAAVGWELWKRFRRTLGVLTDE